MSTSTSSYTIPPRDRPEWNDLVTKVNEHTFKNFVLQMKTAEFSKKISNGQLDINTAIDELYELCSKYSIAVQTDLKHIFKSW